MDEQTRLKARELLLRSRIYRFIALVCGAVGFCMFLYLYFDNVHGNFAHAMKSPATVLTLILPFLPAIIISRMMARAERKFLILLEILQPAPGEDEKKN